ncbi:type IV conjugative transfer system protein TraL [Paraburkholderia sp. EG287A]|uniref:type IV conjugative transfer system protein TraL n=1 Tax=Paraburkholderia sp. EG287A TaxID=3237012 RepID=UPI0034D1AAF6
MSAQRNEQSLRRIPLTADNAVPILFWEPIDFLAGMTVFGMGVALHLFIFGLVGGWVTLMIASRLRRGAKRGAAQHWLWFMGLNIDRAFVRLGLKSTQNDFFA